MHALLLAIAINWNADLTTLATELPKTHPNAFHATTREAFLGEIERLRARAPEMEPDEVTVAIARIVATIGDGHTRLTLPLDAGYGLFQGHSTTAPAKVVFHAIAPRFAIYSDGLFTTDGRCVMRIGALSAEEAIAAIEPVAHGDNAWQKKETIAAYLAVPEVLHAQRVIASIDEVPIGFADGTTTVFRPVTPGTLQPSQPWSFAHRDHAVILDLDEIANGTDETFAAFIDRVFRAVDEKLIIDLRDNFGGNGALNRALVHAIIRSKKLQTPGTLFVLIGRRTFSAAVMLALDLAQNTNAIFIGEPTGGSPNGYGDSRKIVLPESGITVRVSTLYWQKSDPRDKRDTFEPNVYVEPSRDGDAAMAVAMDYFGGPPSPQSLDATWKAIATIDGQHIPVTKDFAQYSFTLRAGTKRLAGVMRANGQEFLVTAESDRPPR